MQLNADFSQRAAVHAAGLAWVPSPMVGVERRMLDRIGAEVARATSIVRYAPDSQFPAHVHGGGEEFLVLDGVFQDEHGDFPAGSYIRNPPTSRHTPGSEPGCTIFVKLWQFDPDDRVQLRLDTNRPRSTRPRAGRGSKRCRCSMRRVRMSAWSVGRRRPRSPSPRRAGSSSLSWTASFSEGGEAFTAQSWLRLPAGAALQAAAGPAGCRLWVKEGHLAGSDRAG